MASKDIMMRLKAQDKTKGAFNQVNKSLGKTENSMNKIKGAMAAAFSTAIILNFAKETLALADTIGKTADSIGVSTDFLQKYQFAAQQSGMSTEEFNKSMQNFSKMVGQSAIRTNEVGRTLEKLGISVRKTDGSVKDSEQVFKELFTALDDVGSEFEKNAILADIFGRAGVKLSVMSKDGADAMQALADSATGVIPEDTIRNAEIFNDTMNELKREVLLPLQNSVVSVSIAFLDLLEVMGLIDKRKKGFAELSLEAERLQSSLEEIGRTGGLKLEGTEVLATFTPEEIFKMKGRLNEVRGLMDEIEGIENKRKELLSGTDNSFQDAVLNGTKKQITVVEQFANTMDGKLTSSFTKFFDFASKEFMEFESLAKSVASAVINELIQIFIVEKLVSSIKTGFTNFASGFNEYDRLVDFDFEGGGYTGSGARAGGLDGRGGMLAMVHPNETVIDHTKGGSMGATVNFNISTVDASGFDTLLASRKGMITAMISNAMNQRGKVGIV
tara:strand:- start:4367 stop:5869 length:1503 start_codon:yes stop_codon:yes gene_type:complete